VNSTVQNFAYSRCAAGVPVKTGIDKTKIVKTEP